MGKKQQDYGVGTIRQLKGLEAVRERPGMYLGSPQDGSALHQCVWEVIDNAVDEHLAGTCTTILIGLDPDGSVTVQDDGRGIPVGIHPEEKINTLEMVMTSLHAGGKFDDKYGSVSAGLHGVGVSAVNAVSSWLHVKVQRDGKVWTQEYSCGIPEGPVEDKGKTKQHGTTVSWKWDADIFTGTTDYDAKRITSRLEELAFLNPGLKFTFEDRRGSVPKQRVVQFEHGITEYVEALVAKKKPATKVFRYSAPGIDTAFAWTESEEDIRCYTNNTFNRDGGTHLTGFRASISKLVLDYAKAHDLEKGLKDGLRTEDAREGLIGVVSIRISNPSFSSQTKDKLVTVSARELVSDLLEDQFKQFLADNPGTARKIAERAVTNARAREAARRAREEVKRKDFMDPLSLPGKLADCSSKKAEDCELFIVEGDSAGGSSKGGRDRRFQAILPLRGKVLNVERASIESILDNKEIGTLITALGCGIETTRTFDMKRLRYHKVIIMTDADVDGAHIRTLLLTFFYRCMPRLLHEGYVYIARPPLFGARLKGPTNHLYFRDDIEYLEFTDTLTDIQKKQLRVTRYKGLGEMNADALWETTLNPQTRQLQHVGVEDAIFAEKIFYELMGENVDHRREWIAAHAHEAQLDI